MENQLPNNFSSKKNIIQKVFKYSILSLLTVLMLGSIFLYFIGYRPILVNGWSMGDVIPYRSIIVIDTNYDVSEIKLGDFITFETSPGGGYVTHKLVKIKDSDENTIAKFKHANSDWEQEGGEIKEYEYQGETIYAWYSGDEINSESIFITTSISPGGSHEQIIWEEISENNNDVFGNEGIRGVVATHFWYIGRLLFFIRDNIILVSGTALLIIILINAIKNDLKS